MAEVGPEATRVFGRNAQTADIPRRRGERGKSTRDQDRGTPRDATPPTPPGIRVPYHGGSTELGLGGRIDLGKSERLEIVVAYGLLDRRVSGHAPEPGW